MTQETVAQNDPQQIELDFDLDVTQACSIDDDECEACQ